MQQMQDKANSEPMEYEQQSNGMTDDRQGSYGKQQASSGPSANGYGSQSMEGYGKQQAKYEEPQVSFSHTLMTQSIAQTS